MDERAFAAAETDLKEWGIIENGDRGLAWTRRFRAAVMREAMRLADEERAGRRPPGPPLATAVAAALERFPLPPAAAATPTHAKFLFALELAALPEGVREIVGA